MKRGLIELAVLLSLNVCFNAPRFFCAKHPKNADIENIGNRNINTGQLNLISLEKEIALGRQLAQQVERSSKLLDDPEVGEYINRLGQNLVRNSDARVPFVIKVIDSDEINALALPGGFFYVNTGLILAAGEESELAGVMAHEIAHVAARHGTEQYSKAELFNLASIPLIFVGGPIGYGIRQAASILVPLQFLRFSRSAEREADFLALQYLSKTGYDPTSFVSFFDKVQAQEKRKTGRLAKAFSTHPPTLDRIQRAQLEIQKMLPEGREYVLNTSEFDRIKAKLEALENVSKPAGNDFNAKRPTLKRKTHEDLESPETGSSADNDQRPKLTRKPGSSQ
jgi:predicted Zn-dependent protease